MKNHLSLKPFTIHNSEPKAPCGQFIIHNLQRLTPPLLSLLLLLYFWATGLSNLDRFPKIHEDESWQAAPGYTFWAEGRFGTELFAGFYGMEQHYYGFMPLFPILVGGALHLLGLGLFQARLVPLALILLTLALTHRLGAKLFSPWHGTIAIAILVTWRIAGPFAHLVSGIPLADVARITRYDSAVPVFGLAALLLLITTADRRVRSLPVGPPTAQIHNSQFTIHNSFWAGLLAGLAALSHVYGAFWLPALLVAKFWVLGRQAFKPVVLTVFGFVLALAPWLFFVASGWTDFMAQNRNYAGRFGVLDLRFYIINLLNEVERYDPILNGAKQSLGAWLWLILCSLSLAWLIKSSLGDQSNNSQSAEVGRQRSAVVSTRILVSVLVTLGCLFALLLSFKTFSYLATLWPLFALAMAAGFAHIWQASIDVQKSSSQPFWAGIRRLEAGDFFSYFLSPNPLIPAKNFRAGYTVRRWWQPFLLFIFLLATAEGVYFNARLHTAAHSLTPYQNFTGAVAAQLPPQNQILGLQHYWLGLAGHCGKYRSLLAPIFWTDPHYVAEPVSFAQAAATHSPQIILLDQIMLDFLAETSAPDHPLHPLGQEIWGYLQQRHAHLIGQVDDPTYGRIQIYQTTAGQ